MQVAVEFQFFQHLKELFRTGGVNVIQIQIQNYGVGTKIFYPCYDGVKDRITSYNVCYTKLLREFDW